MHLSLLFLIMLLCACASRPLSPGETAFAQSVLGEAVDTSRARVVRGSVVGALRVTVPPRPRTTCRERIWPPRTEPIESGFGAMVLGERVYYTERLWKEDFLSAYPATYNLPEAMRFVHEMVHIWQWQARALTGYSPFKASREHIRSDDPYLIDVNIDRPFLDYAYEQQATIVEEFVCCRALDPEGSRTDALHKVVTQVFPEAARRSLVGQDTVFVPWQDVERRGICS